MNVLRLWIICGFSLIMLGHPFAVSWADELETLDKAAKIELAQAIEALKQAESARQRTRAHIQRLESQLKTSTNPAGYRWQIRIQQRWLKRREEAYRKAAENLSSAHRKANPGDDNVRLALQALRDHAAAARTREERLQDEAKRKIPAGRRKPASPARSKKTKKKKTDPSAPSKEKSKVPKVIVESVGTVYTQKDSNVNGLVAAMGQVALLESQLRQARKKKDNQDEILKVEGELETQRNGVAYYRRQVGYETDRGAATARRSNELIDGRRADIIADYYTKKPPHELKGREFDRDARELKNHAQLQYLNFDESNNDDLIIGNELIDVLSGGSNGIMVRRHKDEKGKRTGQLEIDYQLAQLDARIKDVDRVYKAKHMGATEAEGTTFKNKEKERLENLRTRLVTLKGNAKKKHNIDANVRFAKMEEGDILDLRNKDPEAFERQLDSLGITGDLRTQINKNFEDLTIIPFRTPDGHEKAAKEIRDHARTRVEATAATRDAADAAFQNSLKETINQAGELVDKKREIIREELEAAKDPAEGVASEDATHLELAYQSGSKKPDRKAFTATGCPDINADSPHCRKLKEENKARWLAAKETFRLRQQGYDDEAIAQWRKRNVNGTPKKEEPGFFECAWEEIKDVAGSIGSGFATVGEGLWDAGGYAVDKVGSAAGAIINTEEGAFFRSGIFSIFSALAQYRYQKKGSRDQDTQIYRALAISFGASLGATGNLPFAMADMLDPLKPYKRDPLSSQQLLDRQNKMLFDTMTMGGNPNRPGGFPYGTHEQLQKILEGATRPGQHQGFPIYDPNYGRFSGQAYNGYPPFQSARLPGAHLNPFFNSNDPYVRGSGAPGFLNQTLGPTSGTRSVQGLVGATAATTAGVKNFADQLDSINPPDNSLASLIDDVGQRQAQTRALTSQTTNLESILEKGLNSPEHVAYLRAAGTQELANRMGKIEETDMKVPELILRIRRLHTDILPDGDGLMRTAGKRWSNKVSELNTALAELRKLTVERAGHIEAIAVLQRSPRVYFNMQKNLPGVPKLKPGIEPGSTPGSAPIPGSSPGTPGTGDDPGDQPGDWQTGPVTFFKRILKPFKVRSAWALTNPKIALVSNWQKIVREELKVIRKQIRDNNQYIAKHLPEMKRLMKVETAGVHEVNMQVIQHEKMNMKAIALQAIQNLDKLKNADQVLETNATLTAEDRKRIRKTVKTYRKLMRQLQSEAKAGAYELSRVEKLQFEKIKRVYAFEVEKGLGQSLLKGLLPFVSWAQR